MQLIRPLCFLTALTALSALSCSVYAYDYESHGIDVSRDLACNEAKDSIRNAQRTSGCNCDHVENTYWTCSVSVERKRVTYSPPPIYKAPSYNSLPSYNRPPAHYSRPGML